MQAETISNILSNDPYTKKWFRGFSSPDVSILKSALNKDAISLYVLNTDTSDGPGEHWCLALFHPPSATLCEFFDPLGFSPHLYNLNHPISHTSNYIIFNEMRVQGIQSSTCGHHCLFYALQRGRNKSPSDVLKLYSPTNFSSNDVMVYNFIKNNFGIKNARITPI